MGNVAGYPTLPCFRAQAAAGRSFAARSHWTAEKAGGWRTLSAARRPTRTASTGRGCSTRCPSRWVRLPPAPRPARHAGMRTASLLLLPDGPVARAAGPRQLMKRPRADLPSMKRGMHNPYPSLPYAMLCCSLMLAALRDPAGQRHPPAEMSRVREA